jgi:hypothetical protein
MKKKELLNYFTQNLNQDFRDWVGTEIETHFVNSNGCPISVECSQFVFRELSNSGWIITGRKGQLISQLEKDGTKILYELGRQNIELATRPFPKNELWQETNKLLHELYSSAAKYNAYPLFEPIINSEENLLVISDERDALFVKLDGEYALSLLTKCASVQFTIETKGPDDAITILNILAQKNAEMYFKNPYPQELLWREYIIKSNAKYKKDRYGVMKPNSIEDYVNKLSTHDVILNGELVPFEQANQNIDLFLRSIWWNYRLRRYNDRLCIEVRVFPRRSDLCAEKDYELLMSYL